MHAQRQTTGISFLLQTYTASPSFPPRSVIWTGKLPSQRKPHDQIKSVVPNMSAWHLTLSPTSSSSYQISIVRQREERLTGTRINSVFKRSAICWAVSRIASLVMVGLSLICCWGVHMLGLRSPSSTIAHAAKMMSVGVWFYWHIFRYASHAHAGVCVKRCTLPQKLLLFVNNVFFYVPFL